MPTMRTIAIMAAVLLSLPPTASTFAKEPDPMPSAETSGTNRAFSYDVTTTASPARVWALWTDVSTWKTWDRELKDAELAGPMRLGSSGTIISLSGSSAAFEVTEFDPGSSYTFVTNLPLAKLTIRRSIVGTAPTRFRHEVSFSGAAAAMFAMALGPGFRAALPPTMREIAALAEADALRAP